MFAKLNHLAIISENYERSAKFYETMFGMRSSQSRLQPGSKRPKQERAHSAVTVGDGYVGLNINPRRPGRPARFEHFGIEVADADAAFARIAKKYPRIKWQKRPANRPFAAVTTHDPDGNVFDISQKGMENRRSLYVEEYDLHERHVSHFALRTVNADTVAEFYRDVFELEPRNKAAGDLNHYLSDGHITMVIMPWDITDFDGTGIAPPTMDHIGFTVESLDAFKSHLDAMVSDTFYLRPMPLAGRPEGDRRLELARRSCPLCQHHLTDIDGTLLSASEA